MTKAELAGCVAESTGCPKSLALEITNGIFDTIIEQMADGNKVQIIGFGTFSTKRIDSREARNPRSGERVQVQAHNVPRFKPGKQLKEKVGLSSK